MNSDGGFTQSSLNSLFVFSIFLSVPENINGLQTVNTNTATIITCTATINSHGILPIKSFDLCSIWNFLSLILSAIKNPSSMRGITINIIINGESIISMPKSPFSIARVISYKNENIKNRPMAKTKIDVSLIPFSCGVESICLQPLLR